jgi:hypothetical protein
LWLIGEIGVLPKKKRRSGHQGTTTKPVYIAGADRNLLAKRMGHAAIILVVKVPRMKFAALQDAV